MQAMLDDASQRAPGFVERRNRNFAAGLAKTRFKIYVAASAIGVLPATVVFTYFADYPPGYLYVLWLLGSVSNAVAGATGQG